MTEIIEIGLLIYVGLAVLIYWGIQKQLSKKTVQEETLSLQDISVVIPFRNEREHLPQLIRCIKQQTAFPAAIYFVNDHSEDGGEKLIVDLRDSTIKRLDLSADLKGKKSALRFGIERVQTKYVLTMDADVEFSKHFFKNLELLPIADLHILPVVMQGKGFNQLFYALDYTLSQALNFASAGFARPIVASGANLLFSTTVFRDVDSIEAHKHIASGDDVFLLHDFLRNKARVDLNAMLNVAVYTAAPKTLKSFFSQRLRWISKSSSVKDVLSTRIAVAVTGLHFFFLLAFCYLLVTSNWIAFLSILLGKCMFEMILFFPFFNRFKNYKSWLFIPLSTFIYPLYILSLLIAMLFYKNSWKGREI